MTSDKNSPRIVFMGTPEFAVESLDALVKDGMHIVGVVTAPDKAAGRGMKMNESAVKKYAVSNNIPVLQPEKLRAPDFLESLAALKADIHVVVAFRMLPEIVWNMPPLGSINLHGSLLPQYRGAAPINWAVINGEKETGVTTFQLQHEIDTGSILMQRSFPIGENDTAGDVHDRMKRIGAETLVATLHGLFNKTIKPQAQQVSDAGSIRHAPRIFTETCRIDFTKTVQEVHNHVRGLSPYPGAFTTLNGKVLKIFSGTPLPGPHSAQAGDVVSDNKEYLRFSCANGFYEVIELQMEGKKRMRTNDFLKGNRIG